MTAEWNKWNHFKATENRIWIKQESIRYLLTAQLFETPLLHDNTAFALKCYRQAGKEVNRRPFKIFKRINSQNLYSYKHTELMIWSVLLGAQEPPFQTFAELRNDRRSTCRPAEGLLEKKQFDILISSEGRCTKLSPDWGGGAQSGLSQPPFPPL